MESINIYNHDSDLDLLHKNNKMELESWLKLLRLLAIEIDQMLSITATQSSKESLLYQKLKDKQRENTAHLDVYFKYANELLNSAECQDAACNQYFLSRHEEFRRIYNYNLEKYFKVKKGFFLMLKNLSKE